MRMQLKNGRVQKHKIPNVQLVKMSKLTSLACVYIANYKNLSS